MKTIAFAVNAAATADQAFGASLSALCAHLNWPLGHALMLDVRRPGAAPVASLWHGGDTEGFGAFRAAVDERPLERGLAGHVMATGRPQWIESIARDPSMEASSRHGVRAGFAFPVMADTAIAAILSVYAPREVERDDGTLALAAEIAAQLGHRVERERATQALAASEARLSGIIRTASQAIISVDTDGRIRLFNQGAERAFGYSRDEMLGQPLDLLIPPRDRDPRAGDHDALAHAFDILQFMGSRNEVTGLRKDGSEFPAIASVSKLTEPDTLFTIMLRDIAERARMERELEKERSFAATILNSTGALVTVLDRDWRIVTFNQACQDASGYTAEEAIGRRPWDFLLPPEEAPEVERVIGSLSIAQVANKYENHWVAKNGTRRLIAWTNTIVLNASGVLDYAIATGMDVTERRRVENALNRAKEEAELASRAKSEFLANMSHELRTPLNSVIGFAELLAAEPHGALGDAKYRDYVTDIHGSGKHLLNLVNDILDLSKIEVGRVELRDEDIDVSRVIRQCQTLVSERAQSASVEIIVSPAPTPLPLLRADKLRMKQILINLLSNAVKFTPPGGSITIRMSATDRDGFTVEIADTGIGMAPDDIPKALKRFRQVDGQFSRRHEGTGLGLSITKSLVELHGGSLDLESAVNVGTTVTILFPPDRIVRPAPRALSAL